MMLLMMRATINARFDIKCAQLPDDESVYIFIEKTIDEQERIENLINLSKDIEKLTQQINDATLYGMETKITDNRYIKFTIIDN